MSLAEKLTTVAENMVQVHEAGKSAERTTFWEQFQNGGKRNAYQYAFRSVHWTDAVFHPIYPIVGEMQQAFISTGITEINVPLVVVGTISSGFQGSSLKRIASLDLTECTACNRAFYNANEVESVHFTGLIKINELNVSYCPKLDKASLLSLLDCLEPKSDGGTWEVTLGTTNKAKLTEEELAVATGKGWAVK